MPAPCLSVPLVLVVGLCLLPCLLCCFTCLTFELWYEVETFTYQDTPSFVPMTARIDFATVGMGEPRRDTREQQTFLRIKVISYPTWLLRGTNFAQCVQRMCPELTVVPEDRANRIFPLQPLRDFEVVVSVPPEYPFEEVGRMMQALLEQRRLEHGVAFGLRRPRFQAVASTQGTFLHFGGSLGCGHRRWRSCPSRLPSDRVALEI